MSPLIKRELKDKRWSLLAFCLGSLLMIWLYVATFRSSQNSMQQLQELVKTYPKALLDAIGLGDLNLNTIEIYLNAKHFSLLWPILAIVLALSRAGNQIAGEISNRTIGLLLSLPLERWRIWLAKYLSGLATVFIFTAVSLFGVIPLAAGYSIPTHISILFSAWILTSLFMFTIYSAGLAVSSWVSSKGIVYAIMSAVLFASYMAYILSLISPALNDFKYVSIFYYYNSLEVLRSGHIAAQSWCVFLGIIAVTSGISVWRFNRRDIFV